LQIHLRCKDDLSHASAVAFARLSSIFTFVQQVGCLPEDNIEYDWLALFWLFSFLVGLNFAQSTSQWEARADT
jgi:hypothetical protein